MLEQITIILGAVIFLLLLVLLHFLKPELDPSWRMISEYEIGKYGFLMRIAFGFLSLSCFSLTVVIWNQVSFIADIILVIVSCGPLGAAVFATDPISTPINSMSNASKLHTIFGIIFIFGYPIVITIVSLSKNIFFSGSIPIFNIFISLLVWFGFLVFFGTSIYYGGNKKRIQLI